MKRLVPGHDQEIADWTVENFGIRKCRFDMCLGIVEDKKLVGSVMWHSFSGDDIEVSYYGPQTMTLGIARACARLAMDYFQVSRVTARTSRKNKMMTRGIKKVGFEYEGVRHDGYGKGHDAIMYGLYGQKLARLAGKKVH